jgi:hypothetical protein
MDYQEEGEPDNPDDWQEYSEESDDDESACYL